MVGSANMIFGGGPIYTADRRRQRLVRAVGSDGSPATAVAVTAGAIVAVGSESGGDIADIRGPVTERADLDSPSDQAGEDLASLIWTVWVKTLFCFRSDRKKAP
jgi:hypothetical protein